MRAKACHYCGKHDTETVMQQNGGRFCSDGCAIAYQSDIEKAATSLAANGFERSPETPNLYTKDGVSLTVEEVMNEGLGSSLARHTAIVAEQRA